MPPACQLASRKRPVDATEWEDRAALEYSAAEMEEQLCAQAAETLNHFIRSFHIIASVRPKSIFLTVLTCQ